MNLTSHTFAFDNRLLTVEELFRQRKYQEAIREFDQIPEDAFVATSHERGLHLILSAEKAFVQGNYRRAIEDGLAATRLLADFPLNRRYGRIQLVLSKAYSAIGDLKNAEIRAHNSLASYRRAADTAGQVGGLNELARITFIRSEFDTALGYLDEAIEFAKDDPRMFAQMTGNAGTIRSICCRWQEAEANLTTALHYNAEHGQEISQAINLLSLGYLHLRRREFVLAGRDLDKAQKIISRLDLKREAVIYLEYAGELALERGEIARAKGLLSDAYQQGRLIAPDSALVSQSARRLAEAEMALDNFELAMKYGQKALELAQQLGEKAEIGSAKRVIARLFAARVELVDAERYISDAVEVLQEVGDPLELARTLLVQADIDRLAAHGEPEKVRRSLDQAVKLFRKLELDYWVAETEFRNGEFACQCGDLSRGFKKLSRAERLFTGLAEKGKVRAVNQFLQSLADQAVALSLSTENEFKVFGNLVSQSEVKELKSGHVDEALEVVVRRTHANRALIFSPEFADKPVISALSPHQAKRFADNFAQLLGEEISRTDPTLLLDCRRDPYINDLFPETPEATASVIVVPFRMADQTTSFLYLDKLSVDNTINPFSQDELNFAVGFSDVIAFKAAELQKMQLMAENRRLKAQLQEEASFPNIITRSSAMHEILAQVRQVVDSPISISIEGETGCGKDLLARAIHYNSTRRNKRFISVNCAALPETLLESELFGYKRGAFTGADRDKAGLFEEANGGTFFLDEIADMPLNIQAKILRVLEEKEIVRLGETNPVKVDVRVISATNKELKEQIGNGLFRQDLYYRLSALTFRLPPLRERKEDIPLLIQHFLGDSGKTISVEVLKHLVAYDWPGNVRELDNEIKKLILLTGDDTEITTDIISAKVLAVSQTYHSPRLDAAGEVGEIEFNETYSLYDYLAAKERRFIVRALQQQGGVKKHAAAMLNIPESTLRLKIKQYGIDLSKLDAVT
jgi:transcriptional regulator with GAF, ATPase, and Fis domain